MENKNKLILITAGFPFGQGETFLENEVSFLARQFKEVHLISKGNSSTPPRKLPKNFKLHSIVSKSTSLKYLLHLFQRDILSQIILLFFQENGLAKIRVLIHQVLKSEESYQTICSILNDSSDFIVYSYWLDESVLSFPFLKKSCPKTKFVSRAHGWDVYFERHPNNYLPLRSWIAKSLDKIFFISSNGLNYYKKIKGVPKEKLGLSYLGTLKVTKDINLELSPTLNLVSCSSIIPLKRVDLIAKALCQMKNDFLWTHIGDGVMQKEIEALASKSLKTANYQFLGQLDNRAVIDFYKTEKIDLLINTSETEGLPVSMMEAMSCGIPCIGTNVGGVSEIIEDGVNGFLLSANPSPEEISSKIESYNNLSLEEKRKMREAAYTTWNNKFNAEKNYLDFVKEITRL